MRWQHHYWLLESESYRMERRFIISFWLIVARYVSRPVVNAWVLARTRINVFFLRWE